jgi:peroxiredoxin
MSSYQANLRLFEDFGAHVLGVSVDSVPCKAAWARSLGGIDFDLLSDFYPHGEVAQTYRVFHPGGFASRAIFVIERDGRISYSRGHEIPELPSVEALLDKLAAGGDR